MSKSYINILHTRQPKLEYISPAVCESVFTGTGFSSVLLDDAWNQPPFSDATMLFFGDAGDYVLTWDNVPDAICYTILRADDPNNPYGTYTVVEECWTPDPGGPPIWNPNPCTDIQVCPPPPAGPQCYLVQAITPTGVVTVTNPLCTTPCATCGPVSVTPCFATSSPLPNGFLYGPYSAAVVPFSPSAGMVWNVSSGTLPAGLVLNPATGVISGTPEETGDFSFTIRILNVLGIACSKQFALHVGSCVSNNYDLTDGTELEAYSVTLTATSPSAGQIWAIVNGDLPTGVVLNTNTGEIHGTPESGTAGAYIFTVRLTQLDASYCEKEFSLTINPVAGPLDWNDLIWDPINYTPTVFGATSAGSSAGNTFHLEATAQDASPNQCIGTAGANVSVSPLVYSGPLVNCNLQITIHASVDVCGITPGGSNNGALEIYQDGIPLLSLNLADIVLYPVGVYNFPFVVGAGVGTLITFTAVAQCYSTCPTPQTLNYTGVLTTV